MRAGARTCQWERRNGSWIPKTKMPVGEWIASLVHGQTKSDGAERGRQPTGRLLLGAADAPLQARPPRPEDALWADEPRPGE